MHGLGADAHDFFGVPPELGLPPGLPMRFVFPNAPRIPVTVNFGMVMRAWYDISGFDRRGQDERGIRRSAAWIEELVRRENTRGVPTSRIVLAGFSQGGAMSLFAGVRGVEPLAGMMCLSAYLPLDETLATEASPISRQVPVFQAHGRQDPVVPHALGLGTRDLLTRAGYAVEWHEYSMGHTVCPDELRHIGQWLGRILSPQDPGPKG